VDFVNVANPGAQSSDLARQVGVLLGDRDAGGRPVADARHGPVPDICVIMIGANDVTHRMPPALSVRLLSSAVRRLRDAGCEVVVGTCPDLGTIEPVYQPLRWVARRLSRQLAAAQTIAVVGLGGRTVSLGDLLGPEFEARPREMFGPDSYHPSAEGYATAAMAILPTVCSALGVWPAAHHPADRPEAARGEGFLPVDRAAAEAANEGGTEVTAAPRSRWAVLKRRRHAPDHAPAAPPSDRADPADPPTPVPGHADVA
jgi:lysophospholipase L1-like esterase